MWLTYDENLTNKGYYLATKMIAKSTNNENSWLQKRSYFHIDGLYLIHVYLEALQLQ